MLVLQAGVDIFRVFDSLNDIDQLRFGIGEWGRRCRCGCSWHCAAGVAVPGTDEWGQCSRGSCHFGRRDALLRLPTLTETVPQPPSQILRLRVSALTRVQAPTPCCPLTYLPVDTVARAGGVVEGTICYTGDVSNPRASKYTLEYYLNLAGRASYRSINFRLQRLKQRRASNHTLECYAHLPP